MADDCFYHIVVVFGVSVSFGLGLTCLFYGYKYNNVELRATHTNHCKDIHNDDSSAWLIGLCICLAKRK